MCFLEPLDGLVGIFECVSGEIFDLVDSANNVSFLYSFLQILGILNDAILLLPCPVSSSLESIFGTIHVKFW